MVALHQPFPKVKFLLLLEGMLTELCYEKTGWLLPMVKGKAESQVRGSLLWGLCTRCPHRRVFLLLSSLAGFSKSGPAFTDEETEVLRSKVMWQGRAFTKI